MVLWLFGVSEIPLILLCCVCASAKKDKIQLKFDISKYIAGANFAE